MAPVAAPAPPDPGGAPVASTRIVDDTDTEPGPGGPDRPERPAPSAGSPAGVLGGGLAALFGLLIGMRRIYDNSFLTHLATGRIILDERAVPTTDPYSFTATGRPWVVQSWFASLIYGAVDQLGGFGALRVLNGLLVAAIGMLVWWLTARSPSLVVRVGVTTAVLVLGTEVLSGRPLLFGVIGLALVMLAADGRLDPRWLVPVGWVWVNTHGSFPFALVLLGVLAVGTRLDTGRWGREPRVARWAVAGLLLGAVNPLGLRLLTFASALLSNREAFATIREWRAPTYDGWHQYGIVALLALAVLALVRRPNWRDGLVVAVFGALAMTSARNGVVLIVLLAPVLAGGAPRRGPDVAAVRSPLLRPALAMVPVLAVAFTVASLQSPHTNLTPYPVDALDWMEEQGLLDEGSRVVAPDYVGNFREVRDGPRADVFYDDRVDMYPIEVVRDFVELNEGGPGWPGILERHEATAVLWKADSPLGGALERDPGWEIVHRDAQWVVAVPRIAR